MNTISFSHNHNNKLDAKIFTTIRKFTPGKLEYYLKLRDHVLWVNLKGKQYGQATLKKIESSDRLCDLFTDLLRLDTGLWSKEFIKDLFLSFGLDMKDPVIVLWFEGA